MVRRHAYIRRGSVAFSLMNADASAVASREPNYVSRGTGGHGRAGELVRAVGERSPCGGSWCTRRGDEQSRYASGVPGRCAKVTFVDSHAPRVRVSLCEAMGMAVQVVVWRLPPLTLASSENRAQARRLT